MFIIASITQSYFEDSDGSWLKFWRIWSYLVSNLTPWITILSHYWVSCRFLALWHDYKCIKNTEILGGCWWFRTGIFEELVIFGINFDIMNNHHMSLLSCMLIYSSLVWLKVHQEHIHTWSMLMVSDWSFGGLDCVCFKIWHHESAPFVIPELY